jgi:hypothetical protein
MSIMETIYSPHTPYLIFPDNRTIRTLRSIMYDSYQIRGLVINEMKSEVICKHAHPFGPVADMVGNDSPINRSSCLDNLSMHLSTTQRFVTHDLYCSSWSAASVSLSSTPSLSCSSNHAKYRA